MGSIHLGGVIISESHQRAYDLERLERAVTALVEGHRRLERENAALRRVVDEKDHRIRQLDAGILHANQRRQDVTKRIDELIAQIDSLGAQLDAQAESLVESGSRRSG